MDRFATSNNNGVVNNYGKQIEVENLKENLTNWIEKRKQWKGNMEY